MKKIEIAILIACLMAVAYQPVYALDFEFAVGQTHYKNDHNGRWYVEGYPRIEELNDTALSVGLSQKIGSLRYRLEYLNLGEARIMSNAPNDSEYGPGVTQDSCSGCALYTITGRGSVAGGLVSVNKDFDLFGIPFYVEAGAFAFRPKWQVAISETNTGRHLGDLSRNDQMRIGPVLGIGIRYKAVDIGIRYLNVSAGGDVPTYYTDAYTGMIRIFF